MVGGDIGFAATESEKRLKRHIRIGRLLAAAILLMAAFMMGTVKQTKSSVSFSSLTGEFRSTEFSVKSTNSSSFIYFVVANALVCIYSAVSAGLSFAKLSTRLELPLAIGDLAALVFLFTSNAAVAAIELVAWHGASHFGWSKFCNITTSFCGLVTTANVLSWLAAAAYFVLLVLTIMIQWRELLSSLSVTSKSAFHSVTIDRGMLFDHTELQHGWS